MGYLSPLLSLSYSWHIFHDHEMRWVFSLRWGFVFVGNGGVAGDGGRCSGFLTGPRRAMNIPRLMGGQPSLPPPQA